jgi:hypothetical protein
MGLINSPSQPPSSSMQHAASRHRDNLDDYRRDFLRTRVSQDRPLGRQAAGIDIQTAGLFAKRPSLMGNELMGRITSSRL